MSTTPSTYRKSPEATRPRMADAGPAACTRCAGVGGSRAWLTWTCYRCAGAKADPKVRRKVREFPASWSDERCAQWLADKEAKDAAREEAKRAKREAEWAATWAANVTRCPALTDPRLERIEFVQDIAAKAQWQELTDRQVEAVQRMAVEADEAERRDAELDAAGVEVPDTTERVTVVGTVRSVKFVETQFGGTLKMLVEHDSGWKVWGSVPRSIEFPEAGDRVEFIARVERSRDDVRFGFFSRPTKARALV